jgi:hypothetical protein
MALLFCDGFDTYASVAEMIKRGWQSLTAGSTLDSQTKLSPGLGAYGGQCVSFGSTTSNSGMIYPGLFSWSDPTVLNVAMAFKQNGVPLAYSNGYSYSQQGSIMCVGNQAVGSFTMFTITKSGTLAFSPSGYAAYTDAAHQGWINVADGVWHWIEISIKLTYGSTGWVKVYVDGILDMDLENLTTAGNTSWPPTSAVGFGVMNNQGQGGGVACQAFYDDFIVWDNTGTDFNTFPIGQKRIYTGTPTGAGNSAQFTPSSGTNDSIAAQSWTAAAAGTQNLTATAAAEIDLYATNILNGATPSEIDAVALSVYANNPGAGMRSLIPIVQSKGVVQAAATKQLTSTLKAYQAPFFRDSSGLALTAATLNAMQIGAESA